MSNKLILVTAVIIVLILGAIAMTIAFSAPNKENAAKSRDALAIEYSAKDSLGFKDKNACGSGYDYPCFKYPRIEQEKGNGYKESLEQTRLEPCPKPKRTCPLCREELKQEKGNGHMENLVQTRTSC